MIIGISGKFGTGKSHVAKYLKRKLKFQIVDAEKIKFTLLQTPELESKILKTFGKKVLHQNGTIDRNKLFVVAGQDEIRLNVLSEYLDPLIGQKISEIVTNQEDNYIIDTSEPVRQKIAHLFDVSVLVVSKKKLATKRLLKKFPIKVINNIWKWQQDIKNHDFVIENNTSIKDLRADVQELVEEMFKTNNS